MLRKTNPEIVKKQSQIDNCYKLIEILDRQIAEGRPKSDLDFYSNNCGTAFCLIGDYLKDNYEYPEQFYLFCDDYLEHDAFYDFGDLDTGVFSYSTYGTRLQRKERITSHINRLSEEMQELAMEAA